MKQELIDRITEYLCKGGLFNPEHMDHAEVSRLLIDIRDYLRDNPQPLPYVPFVPVPTGPPISTWYGNCPTCGLKLDSVMGYVCSNPDCPTGLGGTKCYTNV